MNKNLGEYREEEKKMGLMWIETNTSETGRGLSYLGGRVVETSHLRGGGKIMGQ